MAHPKDVLQRDHEDALSLLKRLGVDRTRRILMRAQADLERRLEQAVKGPGADSFTAAQARTALQQVREATRGVQRGVRDVLLDGAGIAAEHAGENLERYLESANRAFTGVSRPLGLDLAAMVDAASSGVKATVLRRLASSGEPVEGADEEPHRAKQGILDRYGLATVGHFEEIMQRGLVTRAPWQDVRSEIASASPFLQGAPRYWAERIVRTESHSIYNRSGWESIREADEQLGDMLKILSATFDERTGADSWAVHGQIRRPEESFQSWFGLYQHPPNRPNDREVVVPHRMSWPIPPYLAWRSDAQVLARWHYDGRKGSPPPRPLMTTVPLEKIGIARPTEDAASTAPTIAPPPGPSIPPERFAFRPAPPMPAIKRNEFAAPTPERVVERRAQIDKMAARDAKLFPSEPWAGDPLDDPSAALDLKARKRMKRAKKGDDRKYNIEMPFDFVNDTTNVDSPQYAVGLGGRRSEQLAHAKVERIALEDVVARGGDRLTANRRDVEHLVTHLVNNRGQFVAGEEDETSEYRKPLVVRYGERLYPYSPYELDKFAAAKLVGMKTLDVHVVDLNPHLAAKAREENEKIDQRAASRQRIVEREAKRAKAAVEERVKLEHEGDPDVVAVRIKHQPSEYEKEYLPKYGEAAASIGWGRAMMERGLDMPAYAMTEIAKQFDDHAHPLWGASSIVRNMLKDGGTLRDVLNGPDVTDRKRAVVKKWAATFAHVDAIVPHPEFHLGTHDDNVGSRDATEKKMGMLAGLTDRSVAIPNVVHVGAASDGRAYCETSSVRAWGGKEVRIALKRDEATDVVFHELGHAIEATDRGRGVRASAFLDARTAGEAAKPLSQHLEGHGYEEHEIARKDEFEHPYIGKDYGREQESTGAIYTDPYFGTKEERGSLPETKRVHRATEVTSMAIQRLGDDSGSWSHFEQDPEHFLFGLGQLGGY